MNYDTNKSSCLKATVQSFVRLAFIVCLGAAWGCGSRVASRPVFLPSISRLPERGNACELISEPGEPVGTVALSEPADPAHAPHPSNESERLLFRQLYETLVRVDCTGRVVPGLADSWKFDPSLRAWIVTIRPNPRFSDGTQLTAVDVVSAWSTGGDLRPEVHRLVRSIRAVDERTIEITLRNQSADAPVALAHTDLAIAKRVAGSRWPLGTRPTKIATDGETSPSSTSSTAVITLENVTSIRFLVSPGRDERDLLDQGVDLLLTRDEKVLDYAATLRQVVSLPLQWQRTRVLLTPGRARTSRALSPEERQALADDAVRGPARGALGPFWWQSLPDCEIAYPQRHDQSPSPSGRIVYDAGDGVARDLAERLVGLVRASGPGAAAILDALLPERPNRTYQSATGLSGQALASGRHGGTDAAYIMSFDSRPLDPCREMQALIDDVGWIEPETIVPLVDTRLQAIVRRGRSGVIVDWDGGLLLVTPGR